MKRKFAPSIFWLPLATLSVLLVPTFGQVPVNLAVVTEKPNCQKAKPALKSASVVVYGEDYTSSPNTLAVWCLDAEKKATAQFNEGLKFTDAATLLKGRLAESQSERAQVIELVYKEVMGRPASASDSAYWQAKMRSEPKWWYATMHTEFVKYLNQTKDERQATIQRAYKASLGREAKPSEVEYWMPKTEHYRLIRDASRAWLYSTNGAAELLDVIKRAYQAKKGNVPSEAELKEKITSFGMKKLIFEEMVKAL
jgi:hypothetical protein